MFERPHHKLLARLAAAGNDQAIALVGTLVNLDGTQSYDDDGDEIAYQWIFASRGCHFTARSNLTLR